MKAMRAGLVAALLLVIGGCSGPAADKNSVPVPNGFQVPAGVTLTEGGATLAVGTAASVIYQVADQTRSVVTVAVTEITKGDIADFKFFSLDEASKQSTPFYVTADVTNVGPAGIGAARVPLYAHDSNNTVSLPNQLVGEFDPCPTATLPASFLPGAKATVCLVYLIPKDANLVSIDLQIPDLTEPIRWKP